MSDVILAKGFYFERPSANAPEFVKGKISIKVDEAIEFLKVYRNEKGYVNLDLLLSRLEKKPYLRLNDWKPEKAPAPKGGISKEELAESVRTADFTPRDVKPLNRLAEPEGIPFPEDDFAGF